MVAQVLPEEIVTAILYKTGDNVRIENGQRLVDIFDEVARSIGGEFLQFAAHPQYRSSRTLDGVFQNMLMGGGVYGIGHTKYIRASPHTL